ncbi:MAG: hypothetical protein IJ565_05535 [Bacilli bacterium]|nr:hypothetical protein [Bacilli bacterium]
MDKKEEFKVFVKKHPKLISYVKNGSSSWQKFYEIYDLYGESEDAWKDYLTPAVITGTALSMPDILNFIKNINLDEFQNSINSVSRVLGLLGDMTNKNKTNNNYKPRPMYRHFDD